MFRLLSWLLSTVLLLGVGLAVMNAFDWDIGAVLEWATTLFIDFVNMVAGWFSSMPVFQQAVSR